MRIDIFWRHLPRVPKLVEQQNDYSCAPNDQSLGKMHVLHSVEMFLKITYSLLFLQIQSTLEDKL